MIVGDTQGHKMFYSVSNATDIIQIKSGKQEIESETPFVITHTALSNQSKVYVWLEDNSGNMISNAFKFEPN